MLERITPVILTFNEEANIARTLKQLGWARDVVVVDSFSTDATVSEISSVAQARIYQRAFDSHAQQWNFAINKTDIGTEWFLALDADYVLPDEFVAELAALRPADNINGYSAGFRYCVGGSPLRGTLYPDATILCRRGFAHFRQEGHTQRVTVSGAVRPLTCKVLHDDRKPLARWVSSQQGYARLEAEYLLAGSADRFTMMDKIRRLGWLAPIMVFLYTLIAKGCFLDGRPGMLYVLQRTFAEVLIALEIIDRRLNRT